MARTFTIASPPFGGTGGIEFDDTLFPDLARSPVDITGMTIRSGSHVDAIATTYTLSPSGSGTATHGGSGGTAISFTIPPGHKIIGVRGRSGTLLDHITFLIGASPSTGWVTSHAFGGAGGNPFSIDGEIQALYGRSGSLIDQIGFHVKRTETDLFGGTGGRRFADPEPVPGSTRISRIVIRAGQFVDGISTTYVDHDGNSRRFRHGGLGGTANVIDFRPTERIIAVVGRSGTLLDRIAFDTIDAAGTPRRHGPFGGSGGNVFRVDGNIYGFVGRSTSTRIGAIGFYTD